MARSKSLLSAVIRANAQAAKQRERQRVAQIREAERQVRANKQRAAANIKDANARARAEKQAFEAEMISEAQRLTAELKAELNEIDNVLTHTLHVDDYFELENLRQIVEHPEFSSEFSVPESQPENEKAPSPPQLVLPRGPNAFSSLVGGKKRHSEIVRRLQLDHEEMTKLWMQEIDLIPMKNIELQEKWQKREESRLKNLQVEKAAYKAECLNREISIQKANSELDGIINGLPAGQKFAVENYLEVVMGNSEYPDAITPQIEVTFDEVAREVSVDISAPSPELIPKTLEYKFQKTTGEILTKPQTLKEQKERYENLLCNIAVRTLHEIFEADRAQIVRNVSLRLFVKHLHPGNGKETDSKLIEISTSRNQFLEINLEAVSSPETLKYLKASLSRNLFALADLAPGTNLRNG